MKMQKIEVHIKNTEKWIKLIQEDLELINDKEDYLHIVVQLSRQKSKTFIMN